MGNCCTKDDEKPDNIVLSSSKRRFSYINSDAPRILNNLQEIEIIHKKLANSTYILNQVTVRQVKYIYGLTKNGILDQNIYQQNYIFPEDIYLIYPNWQKNSFETATLEIKYGVILINYSKSKWAKTIPITDILACHFDNTLSEKIFRIIFKNDDYLENGPLSAIEINLKLNKFETAEGIRKIINLHCQNHALNLRQQSGLQVFSHYYRLFIEADKTQDSKLSAKELDKICNTLNLPETYVKELKKIKSAQKKSGENLDFETFIDYMCMVGGRPEVQSIYENIMYNTTEEVGIES